jgi:NitT/TauT family transport system permease protein
VKLLRALAAPLAVLIAWEAICRLAHINKGILPPPSQVARRWIEYLLPPQPYDPATTSRAAWLLSGELLHDACATLLRVLGGFLIGAGLALPIGLLMGARKRVYEYLNPLFQMVRPIPPIAFVPLAILWFGLGNPPAFFLIALGAFFPVLMNTIAGVRGVDTIYLRAAQNLGASQATLFRRVILPASMPYILAGLRVGIGVAFIVVIVAEMIAVNDGLGYRILEAREYFWSDKIIAGMGTIGLIGLAIDTAMARLNAHLLRWHRGLA